MTWLHTWAGLLPGWLLYFIFITGTLGYFENEITRWMSPEVPIQQQAFNTLKNIDDAEALLQQQAPNADQLYIEFPVRRNPFFTLWWHNPKTAENSGWHQRILNPNTGEPVTVRKTEGGELLYRMHYVLHYIPKSFAYWLISLASMFMLVAIISGVIIHKRFFKDFFTFRPNKNQRSWLDMHNLLAVLPLPFHIMITYSGLMLLMFSTMIAIPASHYGVDRSQLKELYNLVFEDHETRQASGIAATEKTPPLKHFYLKAQKASPDKTISFINIHYPGDKNAMVEVAFSSEKSLDAHSVTVYDAASEKVLAEQHSKAEDIPALTFYSVMEVLHEGLFAGPFLRWLYFLSGLMGAGMIASGTILWTNKRRAALTQANNNKTQQFIEATNVAAFIGLPIAIAAYFYANRLVPIDIASRVSWEINTLFIVWFAMLGHALIAIKRFEVLQIWQQQCSIAAIVFAGIPIANALTTSLHLGLSLKHQDWMLAGFDLFMWVLSLAFAYTAWRLRKKRPEKKNIKAEKSC